MSEHEPLSVAIAYARDRYNEELARIAILEQKASRLLTALTVAITGFTLGAQSFWGAASGPMRALEWSVRAFLVLTFVALAVAWKKVLNVVQPTLLSAAPKDGKALDYIKTSDEAERDDYIYCCYRDTLERLANELTEQEDSLKASYDLILAGGGFLLIFIILASIERWAT